ncbi:MAG: TIGR03790 family protein [Methanomassiliicoccales archaeon]|nr:MAG: TIGR03790 family protein [Methanomassiliicoccales archaeon]
MAYWPKQRSSSIPEGRNGPSIIILGLIFLLLIGCLHIFDGEVIQIERESENRNDFRLDPRENDIQLPDSQKMKTTTRSQPEYYDLISYDDVLVIRNLNSPISMQIADYFQAARNISNSHICNISTLTIEVVSRTVFENEIRGPIEDFIVNNGLLGQINYIVTTKGVPLRVLQDANAWDTASVDSELTMILGPYQSGIGQPFYVNNPYFDPPTYQEFSWSLYGIFLVTRFTGYDWDDIKPLIDKPEMSIGRKGTFVLDVDPRKDGGGYEVGNTWMRDANVSLTAKGFDVVLDETNTFLTGNENVSGYCSWGSNDGSWNYGVNQNYGFETDSNGDDLPDNWLLERDFGNDDIDRNNTRKIGSWSLRINRSVVNTNYSAASQNVTIKPGVRYFLKGQVNFSSCSGGKGAHLRIEAYNGLDLLVWEKNGNPRTSPPDLWRSLNQVIYEPIDGVTKLCVSVIFSEASGEGYFDDVRLVEIKPDNTWIPGAIVETYVSTGGRSFTYGTQYGQSLVADLIMDGVTGTKGYVYEPFLDACAHPDIYLDAYTDGFKLAESYYMASVWIGWMDVVIGDPKLEPYDSDIIPDLEIVSQNISFSEEMPGEGDSIDITATFENRGPVRVSNITVEFWAGDPGSGSLLGSKIVDVEGFDSNSTSIVWDTGGYGGFHNITVFLDAKDIYFELSESNNIANRSIAVHTGPPTADAGKDDSVNEDSQYTFNASASTDNTSIENYTWDFGDGSLGYGEYPTHTYTLNDTYEVVLNVTNVFGFWDQDTMNISVNNVIPTADAGEDESGIEGQPLTFNASGSWDTPSDIDTLNYTWYFGDGNIGFGMEVTYAFQDNGTYNVTLEVRDDDGAKRNDTLNVTLSNSDPQITQLSSQISQEDSIFTIQIYATDVSGDTITFFDNSTLFTIDPVSGEISFTPQNEDVGDHLINITAFDEDGGEGYMEFLLTVENTNDPPHIVSTPITDATEETLYQYQVVVEDDDLLVSEYEVITYSLDSAPSGMEIDSMGIINWTPNDLQASYTFNVIVNVSDGEEFDLQIFDIDVTNLNDEPEIVSTPVTSALEDHQYTYDVNANDVDQGDVLTYKLDIAPQGMTINEESGVISWLPTNDDVGENRVRVNVSDVAGYYHTQEFTLIVTNTNDKPFLEPIGELVATEDQLFEYQVVATDVDSGDVLSFYDDSGLFQIDKDTGIIFFTPSNDDVGTHTVKVTVKDEDGAMANETVTFKVLNANDPPVLDFISNWQATEDKEFTLTITADDIDADDSMTFSDNTTLFDIDPNTGEITFTPKNEDVGVHLVNISVVDENGLIDFQEVTFIIENTNDPPSIDREGAPDATVDFELSTGGTFTYKINVEDVDTGDTLTFSDDTDLFDIDPNTGEISFTPTKDDVGTHTVTITVTDSEGDTDSLIMTFEVVGEKEEGVDLIWLMLSILVVIIVIVILYFGWKRKRATSNEEVMVVEESPDKVNEIPKPADLPPPPPPPPPPP